MELNARSEKEKTMLVRDVMVATPACCTLETNLGAAVETLWNRNCGILPVVDAQEKVIAVVTDRDLCVALGTRNKLPGEITVREVASQKLFSCKPGDEIRIAMATMAREQVRRLPVVNAEGKPEGILSMDDVLLHAGTKAPRKASELSSEEVVNLLKQLYRPQLPEVARRAAAST
jgi:CBS domain-containing protein